MSVSKDKIYEEIGETYRFFAKWRQLAFAGYLAVLAAVVSFVNSAADHRSPPALIKICFLIAGLLGVVFWIADRRTARLAFFAISAGKKLETGTGGFFTETSELDKSEQPSLRHSHAAHMLFLGGAGLCILAAVLFPCAIPPSSDAQATTVQKSTNAMQEPLTIPVLRTNTTNKP